VRLAALTTLLAATVLVSMVILPVWRPDLQLPPGQAPAPPTIRRSLTLTYSGVRRPELLPHVLTLLPDTTLWFLGRRTYRAIGDGDVLWHHAWWAFAGPDSIDVTAHHQAILRLSRDQFQGSGRGVPYLDGTLFSALFFPHQGSFLVWSRSVPCSRT
jgi:hypothetical protein